ncbi:hypothetical protein BKA70DRAFT_1234980 [Coprinopsis sp. MPI-PUGE-AT-0042]|nr:hypothetical protein BKA70DRAFT_1234980 [Coprinopsis sp. MPI-PUGE-AT-0042]
MYISADELVIIASKAKRIQVAHPSPPASQPVHSPSLVSSPTSTLDNCNIYIEALGLRWLRKFQVFELVLWSLFRPILLSLAKFRSLTKSSLKEHVLITHRADLKTIIALKREAKGKAAVNGAIPKEPPDSWPGGEDDAALQGVLVYIRIRGRGGDWSFGVVAGGVGVGFKGGSQLWCPTPLKVDISNRRGMLWVKSSDKQVGKSNAEEWGSWQLGKGNYP